MSLQQSQSSTAAGVAAKQERRAAPRVDFQVGLWFAIYDRENFPAASEFRCGETRNLSPMGISFFTDRVIEPGQMVVVKLGRDSQTICLSATVIHCQHDKWGSEDEFFVGCEFASRLEPS